MSYKTDAKVGDTAYIIRTQDSKYKGGVEKLNVTKVTKEHYFTENKDGKDFKRSYDWSIKSGYTLLGFISPKEVEVKK